jgi:hypothetical protein
MAPARGIPEGIRRFLEHDPQAMLGVFTSDLMLELGINGNAGPTGRSEITKRHYLHRNTA